MPEEIRGQGKFPRAIRELQEATFGKSAMVRNPRSLTDMTTRGAIVRPIRASKQQPTYQQQQTIPRWG